MLVYCIKSKNIITNNPQRNIISDSSDTGSDKESLLPSSKRQFTSELTTQVDDGYAKKENNNSNEISLEPASSFYSSSAIATSSSGVSVPNNTSSPVYLDP